MRSLTSHHSGRTHLVLATVLSATAVLLFAPAADAATPAHVQSRAQEVNAGTSNNLAFSSPNAAGNLIVVYAMWSNTSAATVTDTQGNNYASAAPVTRWNNNTWSSQVFYAKNVAAGANTVRTTFGTAINSFGIVYIHEYSGIDPTNPLDVAAATAGTGSAMNSGSATTTNANDLIFGAAASTHSVTAAGTGFTTRRSDFGNLTEDRLVTATGAYNASATQNGPGWAMHMVAFRADTRRPGGRESAIGLRSPHHSATRP